VTASPFSIFATTDALSVRLTLGEPSSLDRTEKMSRPRMAWRWWGWRRSRERAKDEVNATVSLGGLVAREEEVVVVVVVWRLDAVGLVGGCCCCGGEGEGVNFMTRKRE
jgi:hypothetical protein